MIERLKIKYLAASNFLCFGPEGVVVDLEKFGNVVLISGENYDDIQPGGRPGSNGTGKSSIQEILVYGLYGKPVKRKLTQKEVVHNRVGKNGRIEVRWDRYRVVRTIKPNSLRIWESEDSVWDDSTEITPGSGMRESDKMIESIVGLSYAAFVNLVCFDDRNSNSFLECDAPTKRSIVENLLSLDKYREYSQNAKEHLKDLERKIKTQQNEYTRLLAIEESVRERIAKLQSQEHSWKEKKQADLNLILTQIKDRREQMKSTDLGAKMTAWHDAQERITSLNATLKEQEARLETIERYAVETRDKLVAAQGEQAGRSQEEEIIRASLNDAGMKLMQARSDREAIARLDPGASCGSCRQEIDLEHQHECLAAADAHVASMEESVKKIQGELDAVSSQVMQASQRVASIRDAIRELSSKGEQCSASIRQARQEIQKLSSMPKPEETAEIRVLEEQIASLKNRAIELNDEMNSPSPYSQSIQDAVDEERVRVGETRVKRDELKESEQLIPYFKFWVGAFGDDGIRKFVIDGIIPALNSRVAHWLDVLIQGNITLEFDNRLEESIGRIPFDGDPFVYNAMSGGEQRRINLAVTQAFSHIMMLSSGRVPDTVFLDEVAINIDENGIMGVYRMILELSRDRRVFVTTHDPHLISLLQGCSILALERKNGSTKIR